MSLKKKHAMTSQKHLYLLIFAHVLQKKKIIPYIVSKQIVIIDVNLIKILQLDDVFI